MAEVPTIPISIAVTEERTAARHLTTSWYARIIMAGAVCIVTGLLWDISWHQTVGRDTFWTPAHMAIYLGGVLGGCVGGWLAMRGTLFAPPEEKAGMISVLGLRAPFGAWLCIWGALAMLTSAPFDNWWHGAYGLDVKILSPPHTVLALGMWAIVWGALFLVVREQNVARQFSNTWTSGSRALPGQWLTVIAGGILIAMVATFHTEYSWPNQQRTITFYLVSSVAYPLYLTALARASSLRWGATLVAAVYMVIFCLQGWLLPMFPGHPKLGPVYNPVDHFVPLPFPQLLVIPALSIDGLAWLRGSRPGWWRDWLLAGATAISFTVLFFVTQWIFSAFMISEASHNRFFFGDLHWGYNSWPGPYRAEFWQIKHPEYNPPVTWSGMMWTLLVAFGAVRVGLWFGNWLAKVKR